MTHGRLGLIHFHSEVSADCFTPIKTIVRHAVHRRLDYLVLTDHDTVEGSRRLRAEVARRDLPIEVPLAAEYRTEFGDVIAAFIQSEIADRRFDRLVSEVRAQEGLLLLPHPTVQHEQLELLCSRCDLIEVFNSRCSAVENAEANRLAERFGKVGYYGSDAHDPWSLQCAATWVPTAGDLRQALLAGRLEGVALSSTPRSRKAFSQAVKGVKKRDSRLLLRSLVRAALFAARRQ